MPNPKDADPYLNPPPGMSEGLYKFLAYSRPATAVRPWVRFLWFWDSWLFGVCFQEKRCIDIRLGPLGVSFRRRGQR